MRCATAPDSVFRFPVYRNGPWIIASLIHVEIKGPHGILEAGNLYVCKPKAVHIQVDGFWTAKYSRSEELFVFPHWDMLPVTGYGARLPLLNHFGFGRICFFYNNLGDSEVLEDGKQSEHVGLAPGPLKIFWAPGGSDGARPEASFVLPSIHIVEKISFCFIRISLNFGARRFSIDFRFSASCGEAGICFCHLRSVRRGGMIGP